mgnify:CR=1 FL=1
MDDLDYTYSYFFMWGKDACPYCIQARQLFFEKCLPHVAYAVDERPELLAIVQERFQWNTVPLIVEYTPTAEQKFIGGYEDLVKYIEEGEEARRSTP